jgi:hypothetical protein
MAFREGSDTRIRYGRLLGMIFITAGFIIIGIAWNGAASRACVDCQFPYLISGGATGLGLIGLGATLLLVSSLRAERLHLEIAIREAAGARAAPTGDVAAAPKGGSRTGAAPNGRVVMGASTYHRPDCRLVVGKEGLPKGTAEEASASGLTACRVCNPARADAGSARK